MEILKFSSLTYLAKYLFNNTIKRITKNMYKYCMHYIIKLFKRTLNYLYFNDLLLIWYSS